ATKLGGDIYNNEPPPSGVRAKVLSDHDVYNRGPAALQGSTLSGNTAGPAGDGVKTVNAFEWLSLTVNLAARSYTKPELAAISNGTGSDPLGVVLREERASAG